VDDAADGLHPLPFQDGAVVSLDDVDRHRAIAHLKRHAISIQGHTLRAVWGMGR